MTFRNNSFHIYEMTELIGQGPGSAGGFNLEFDTS